MGKKKKKKKDRTAIQHPINSNSRKGKNDKNRRFLIKNGIVFVTLVQRKSLWVFWVFEDWKQTRQKRKKGGSRSCFIGLNLDIYSFKGDA